MSKFLFILFLSALAARKATAFVPTDVAIQQEQQLLTTKSTTRLMVWFPNDGIEAARGSFPLWLFGAAGSGGVARKAIPDAIDEFKFVQGLRDEGTTKGGPTIGLSPLIGYPRDLSMADIDEIVNNPLSVEQMIQKYAVPNNFFASKGYLTYDAYLQANAKANPLTVRAVFDSFGKPSTVEPYLAQQKLDEYKSDKDASYGKIKANMFVYKLRGFSAIFALLLLLGLADVATATDAYRGWFPDWPGGVDFPFRLLTADGNPFTIPDYFITDIPEGP